MTHGRYAACIGSRGLTPEQLGICKSLGGWLVQCGWTISSGNAPGADQAFAQGGNRIDPTLVHLHLPWPKFHPETIHPDNQVKSLGDWEEFEREWFVHLAKQHHPAWGNLTQGGEKLMTRNGPIMRPCFCHPVDLCLAWPSNRRGGGGTGQGMRIALDQGIELVDLSQANRDDLRQLCENIYGNSPSQK